MQDRHGDNVLYFINLFFVGITVSRNSFSLSQALKLVGKTRKKKARSLQFPPVLFSCLRFLNTEDPTISEPL